MKTFPMFLKVAGRRIIVIGGGEQAAQKARLALKTEAELIIAAPELDPELASLVKDGRASHHPGDASDLFNNTALVFVGTGCKGADAAWHARAKAAGALVNVVDYPDLCDAMTPSIVDRDPVVVAIGTEGTAPVLGRRIKSQIEQILHPRVGTFAALAGRLRAEVARHVPATKRRAFWHWVFGGTPWRTFSTGNEREAAELIKAAVKQADASKSRGRLSIVSGATAPDLVSLGIVERLQSADVIYVARDVPETVLELARRDARLVKMNFAHHRLSDSSLKMAANEASESCNVVYLSAGFETFDLPDVQGILVEHLNCARDHPDLQATLRNDCLHFAGE